jgi:transcriptional regulator with XRE-family HTH domain
MTVSLMTSAQCRAARALLDITQSELATAAGLGLSTVVDFEKGRRQVSKEAIKAMQGALERAGIAFKARGAAVALSAPLRMGLAEEANVFKEPSARLNNLTHMVQEINREIPRLSGMQIRAARALLRWSAADLARASALGVNTIRRAEIADEGTALTAANEFAIHRAFEAAGVVFIGENGGGPGVRLRERLKGKLRRPRRRGKR